MHLTNSGLIAAAFVAVALVHEADAAEFKVIHTFLGGKDGQYPDGGLTADADGNLYGTSFGDLGGKAPGKNCGKSCGNLYNRVKGGGQKTLHLFHGGSDGAFPAGELLVQGNTIYGITEYGPGVGCAGLGCGTVYSESTDGSSEHVFKFCTADNCTDGYFPNNGVIADPSGNLYGMTTLGGLGDGRLCGTSHGGCGTIYQMTPGGQRTVLYSFCSRASCADGAVPLGTLMRDENGNLFGTTEFGGAYTSGVVFKLAADGTYSVLYDFCANNISYCPDGSEPEAAVLADSNGNLYGTTAHGGGADCTSSLGCGVIFKLTPDGASYGYSVLYRFQGGNDGSHPQSPLVAVGGDLYGTTLSGGGGCSDGCGTVYSLVKNGIETVVHAFGSDTTGGEHPKGALFSLNGFLYGATRTGGDPSCKCGTLYKIKP